MTTSWRKWASLRTSLPSLAEAAPNEFLSSIEKDLATADSPFQRLFEEEESEGSMGQSYFAGILWALEGLAWVPEHLSRVAVTLSALASVDPGGQWSNRPLNSLVDIFLPWTNNTSADIEQRGAALLAVKREYPDIAWELLAKLLPNQTRSSSGTHKPEWMEFADLSREKVTVGDYRETNRLYCDRYIEMAADNISRLPDLVDSLDALPVEHFDLAISILDGQLDAGVDHAQSTRIWEKLTRIAAKHRRFSTADWSMPQETVSRLDNLIEKAQPVNLVAKYLPLFSHQAYDLLDDEGGWKNQEKLMEAKRVEAVRELTTSIGFDGIADFSSQTDSPYAVGAALAKIWAQDEPIALLEEFIASEDPKIRLCMTAYIHERYIDSGDTWLDQLGLEDWQDEAASRAYAALPFNHHAWNLVRERFGKKEHLYWTKVSVKPLAEKSRPHIAVDRLIKYERPLAAIEVLYDIFRRKTVARPRIAKTLLATVSSKETPNQMDTFYITELIQHLQADPKDIEKELFQIEWAYLPLLEYGHRVSPKFLHSRLAADPDLFCDVIRSIYKSRKTQKEEPISEDEKQLAGQAYRLLMSWRRPPGLKDDGNFDENVFSDWISTVVEKSEESGHIEVALIQAGEVLVFTPEDPSGLWINRSVAETLNEQSFSDLRRGFSTGVFNSRGVHSIDPQGKPELELANNYAEKAKAVDRIGLQRLATTLRDIAEDYTRQAEEIIARHTELD